MKRLLNSIVFWLRCVWHFRLTPRQIQDRYADLCLFGSADWEQVGPGLYVAGNQHTHVLIEVLTEHGMNGFIALNCDRHEAVTIQISSFGVTWEQVFRRTDKLVVAGPWVEPLRRVLRLKLKPRINALTLTPLRNLE